MFISLSRFQFPRAPTCLCAHMISIIDSVTEQVSKMDVKIGVPQLVPTASKKIKKFRKWNGWQPPGIEPKTPGLSWHCSAKTCNLYISSVSQKKHRRQQTSEVQFNQSGNTAYLLLFPTMQIFFFQWFLSWLLHKWREGYLLQTWARKCSSRHQTLVCTSSLSPWWRLEHSVEMSASYFLSLVTVNLRFINLVVLTTEWFLLF